MSLHLPEVDRRALARAPLAVTALQIRYEQNLTVGDGDTGLLIHEQLGGRDGQYPRVEPQQSITAQMQISPVGITPFTTTSPPAKGWRIRDEEGNWTISVMPDFVALETTAYTTWTDDFRVRFRILLEAISQHVSPRVEERLGLRYINRVTEADINQPTEFQGIISAGLLGPAIDPFWQDGVTGLQQQVELDVAEDIKSVIRHGTLPRSTGYGIEAYLLDIDIFRQQPRRFDAHDIADTADTLNNAATALFQSSLTGEYLERLRRGSE